MRDYNFWVYVMTNDHDTVLYIGMTNDLVRRISRTPYRRNSGIYCGFPLSQAPLLRALHRCAGRNRTGKAAQEWSRKKKGAWIATVNPRWQDLARELLGDS